MADTLVKILELFKDKLGIVMFILAIFALALLGIDIKSLNYTQPEFITVIIVVYVAILIIGYYGIVNRVKAVDNTVTQNNIAKALNIILDYIKQNSDQNAKILDTISVISNKIDGIPNKSLLIEMLIVRTKSMLNEFLELILDFNPDSINTPETMKRSTHVLNSGITKIKKDYLKYVKATAGDFLSENIINKIDDIIIEIQNKFVQLVSNNSDSLFNRLYELTSIIRELEDKLVPIYSENLQVSITSSDVL